jgi:hypothetical protein
MKSVVITFKYRLWTLLFVLFRRFKRLDLYAEIIVHFIITKSRIFP